MNTSVTRNTKTRGFRVLIKEFSKGEIEVDYRTAQRRQETAGGKGTG